MSDDRVLALLEQIRDREERDAHDNLVYAIGQAERWEWRRFVDASECSDTLTSWMEHHDPQWPMYARELMALLQAGGDLDQLDEPEAWALGAHVLAQGLPEWGSLAELCEGRRWDAGISAMAVAQAVKDLWDDQPKVPCQSSGEGGAQGEAQDEDPPQEPSDEPQSDDVPQGTQSTPEPVTSQQDASEGQDEGGDENPEPHTPGGRQTPPESLMRNALRQAVRGAMENIEEMDEAIGAMTWGLTGSGGQDVPPEERERLAKLLSRNRALKEIAIEMGRLLRIAGTKRRTEMKHVSQEVFSTELGQDLARVLPSELALLEDELMELEFYRRFAERQLLCYALKGRECAARGPVIVCVDVSGSMRGPPATYAAATALALVGNAVRDGRRALVLPFDTRVREVLEFNRATLVDSSVRLASLGGGGGTSWRNVLSEAREIIEKDQSSDGEWRGADVVLITDGDCSVFEEWAKDYFAFRKKIGVTAYSILVPTYRRRSYYDEQLRLVSDKIYLLSDLQDGRRADVICEVHR